MPIMQRYHEKAGFIMRYGGRFLKAMTTRPATVDEFLSRKALAPVFMYMEQKHGNGQCFA